MTHTPGLLHDALPDLLLPVKAKVVITGAAFGLWKIMLEKLRLCDQYIIQTDDIKRLYTEQDDKKPHKEPAEGIASLYTVPAAIHNHAAFFVSPFSPIATRFSTV